MKKKPIDPMIERARVEPAVESVGELSELPACAQWRALVATESMRPGDYQNVNGWQLVVACGPAVGHVLRPLGACWLLFVGPSAVSPPYRTGEPDKPFASVADAVVMVPDGVPYLIYRVGENVPVAWRDPAEWDWGRYLGTGPVRAAVRAGVEPEAQVLNTQQLRDEVRADTLRDLLASRADDPALACQTIPDTELREHISPEEQD